MRYQPGDIVEPTATLSTLIGLMNICNGFMGTELDYVPLPAYGCVFEPPPYPGQPEQRIHVAWYTADGERITSNRIIVVVPADIQLSPLSLTPQELPHAVSGR